MLKAEARSSSGQRLTYLADVANGGTGFFCYLSDRPIGMKRESPFHFLSKRRWTCLSDLTNVLASDGFGVRDLAVTGHAKTGKITQSIRSTCAFGDNVMDDQVLPSPAIPALVII